MREDLTAVKFSTVHSYSPENLIGEGSKVIREFERFLLVVKINTYTCWKKFCC